MVAIKGSGRTFATTPDEASVLVLVTDESMGTLLDRWWHLDNYGIHCCSEARRALLHMPRIQLHFLPPYCPDHNRIERFWQDLHANVTRNHRHTFIWSTCVRPSLPGSTALPGPPASVRLLPHDRHGRSAFRAAAAASSTRPRSRASSSPYRGRSRTAASS
jgi:hypothetical protein